MTLKNKLNIIFEKVSAGYFAIFTGIVALVTVGFASLLYYLGDVSFSMSSHWISHLGNGPNNSGIAFTIGLIIAGILAIIFLIDFYHFVNKGMEGHRLLMLESFFASMVSVAGLLINAIWNYKDDPNLHVMGSATFFFGGFFMLIFYSIAMFYSPSISRNQAYIGFAAASVFGIYLINFLPFTFDPNVDLMELLLTTDPRASIIRVLEWAVFFAVIFWFIEIGIYQLKVR